MNFTLFKRLPSTCIYYMSAKDTVVHRKDVLCRTILNGNKLVEEAELHFENGKDDILF